MMRCLRDETLLLLHEGEGSDLERGHLKACLACARRYRRLVRELKVIGQVLREEPPLRSLYHRPRPFYVRWVPLATALTALAVVLAVSLGGMRARRVAFPVPPKESGTESVSQFLEEVSNVIFSAGNGSVVEPSSSSSTFAYLREALGEE